MKHSLLPVFIALGAVFIGLFTTFVSLLASRQKAKKLAESNASQPDGFTPPNSADTGAPHQPAGR